jgi:hypothetical protein
VVVINIPSKYTSEPLRKKFTETFALLKRDKTLCHFASRHLHYLKGTKYYVSFVSRGRFKFLKLIHASGFVDDCKQTDRTKFNLPILAKMELGNKHFLSTVVDYQGVAIAQRSKPFVIIVQKKFAWQPTKKQQQFFATLEHTFSCTMQIMFIFPVTMASNGRHLHDMMQSQNRVF